MFLGHFDQAGMLMMLAIEVREMWSRAIYGAAIAAIACWLTTCASRVFDYPRADDPDAGAGTDSGTLPLDTGAGVPGGDVPRNDDNSEDIDGGRSSPTTEGGVSNSEGTSCESSRGPAMLLVETASGPACVDQREVTAAEYGLFLGTNEQVTWSQRCSDDRRKPELPTGNCNGNTVLAQGDQAVACITWCQADAYCSWAGKRLCRSLELVVACQGTPSEACHFGFEQSFPTAASEYPECVSSIGIHGLLGNQQEWLDCGDNESDCPLFGGGFFDGVDTANCVADESAMVASASGDFGVRCCRDSE